MLRKVGVLVGLVVFAGSLLAADPDDKDAKKASKPMTGRIVKVDPAKGMLTIRTRDGDHEITIGEDTKIMDAQGHEIAEGLKDKRLAAGSQVTLTLGADGKAAKEVHLAAAPNGAAQARTGQRRRRMVDRDVAEKPEAPATPGEKPHAPPAGGTVVKVDMNKKSITLKMADAKGKLEERTIDVKEGVKLVSAEGGQADIRDFVLGSTVLLTEKDGKVTEIHQFKLGAGVDKEKIGGLKKLNEQKKSQAPKKEEK
jgi:hypothetical protein